MTNEPAGVARIGPYRIIDRLGKGGMGEVFVAQRDGSDTLCALKRLGEHSLDHGGLRLRREAHVTTYLRHPSIARVLDAKETDGDFCVVTELVHGVTLEQLMFDVTTHGERFDLDVVARIASDMLSALAYAHTVEGPDGPLGIVHRDIAPKNMIVGFDGRLRLIDFGLVRAAVHDAKTTPGALMGTPAYMAPEQAVGEEVDGRTDSYAAAVIVHELIVHRRAVADGRVSDMLRYVVTEELPAPSTLTSTVGEEVDAVMRDALAKTAEHRSTAAKFLSDLERVLPPPAPREKLAALVEKFGKETKRSYERWSGQVADAGHEDDRHLATRVASAPRRSSPPPPTTSSSHRRWLIATAAGSMTALLVGVVLLLSRNELRAPERPPPVVSVERVQVAPRATPAPKLPPPKITPPPKVAPPPPRRRPPPRPQPVEPPPPLEPTTGPAPKLVPAPVSAHVRRLRELKRSYRQTGRFDAVKMEALVDELEADARADAATRAVVRRARGCLRTCSDVELVLTRASAAVAAVDRLQRTAE